MLDVGCGACAAAAAAAASSSSALALGSMRLGFMVVEESMLLSASGDLLSASTVYWRG